MYTTAADYAPRGNRNRRSCGYRRWPPSPARVMQGPFHRSRQACYARHTVGARNRNILHSRRRGLSLCGSARAIRREGVSQRRGNESTLQTKDCEGTEARKEDRQAGLLQRSVRCCPPARQGPSEEERALDARCSPADQQATCQDRSPASKPFGRSNSAVCSITRSPPRRRLACSGRQ